MPLSPDTVLRTDDASGDTFLTFLDGSSRRVQGIAIVNLNADPMGVTGTPMVVSVSNNVSIDDTIPIDVNIASETHSHTHIQFGTAGAAVASAVLSASPSTLVELRVILDPTATTDRYVMLFDATSLPSNGTVPIWRGFLPGGVELSESWTETGLDFPTNGIVVAISSTIDTLTVTGVEAFFHSVRF